MNKFFIIILMIFLLGVVYGQCNENQIDINTASLSELDKLDGIGPAKAQEIINSRPFNSINELIEVKGIGNVTLDKIKQQGLACIDKEPETQENDSDEEIIENKELEQNEDLSQEENNQKDDALTKKVERNLTPVSLTAQPINIDTKDIKSEDNKENLRGNLALYGIIASCFVFGGLLLLKKKKYKNEFQ